MRIIGLMSGTSFDGIDVAAAELRQQGDELTLRPLGALVHDYVPELRNAIRETLPPNTTSAAQICELDTLLGGAFAEAARRGMDNLCSGRADLVVSHGQTIFHWVEDGRALGTLQLGSPSWIQHETGLAVVSDLRSADVAAGGQGAPLVPMFDALLLPPSEYSRAALNLGGIANITVIPPAGPVLGYDTGPASALLDAACWVFFGQSYDEDGQIASRGQVDAALLEVLLAEPYYARSAPKSTGKELFHGRYVEEALARVPHEVDRVDVVTTLTELTALTVAVQVRRHGVRELLVSGGGLSNTFLMGRIREQLAGCVVRSIDELGVPSAAKEAYAFAVLGYLTWHGFAGTIPSVTGASRASVLGSITPGSVPLHAWQGLRPSQAPKLLHIVEGEGEA